MAPRFEQTVKLWHLVVSLLAVVLGGAFTAGSAWASLNSKLSEASSKVNVLAQVKDEADKQDRQRWTELDRDVATLKSDISWIRQALGGK